MYTQVSALPQSIFYPLLSRYIFSTSLNNLFSCSITNLLPRIALLYLLRIVDYGNLPDHISNWIYFVFLIQLQHNLWWSSKSIRIKRNKTANIYSKTSILHYTWSFHGFKLIFYIIFYKFLRPCSIYFKFIL